MSTVSVGPSWCVVVSHHPRGARTARHRLADELADLLPPERLADAVAVLGELVGNAIRHADPLPGGVIRVDWALRPGPEGTLLWMRVTDGGSGAVPRIRAAGEYAPDGRGLHIVAALADRWGVERLAVGQRVWAELACRPGAGAGTPERGTGTVSRHGSA